MTVNQMIHHLYTKYGDIYEVDIENNNVTMTKTKDILTYTIIPKGKK